jgi:hypothetical protein
VVLVDQGSAPGGGHEQRPESEQTPAGSGESDDGAAAIARSEVEDGSLAGSDRLGDGTDVLVGHVHHRPLQRLVGLAIDRPKNHFRAAHLNLEALAPHRLDEDGQLQLSPTGHFDDLGRTGRPDPDGDVAQHLSLQPVLDLTGGEELALAAGQR